MSKNLNPSEIARDTLRQLALQRKLPTPDNYREIYHEIAGTEDRLPFPEGDLKAMVGVLPRQTGEQNKLGRALDAAVAARDWKKLAATLGEFIAKAGAEPPNWSGLLRTLLAQYNARHASLTTARKREALEHVFAASATPDLLFTRLQSVLRGWEQSGVVADEADAEAPPAAERAKDGLDLREFVAHVFDHTLAVLVAEQADLVNEIRAVAAALRAASAPEDIRKLSERIKKLGFKLDFVVEDQTELKAALQHLVGLIIENIEELVVDDRWLSGQINVVRDLLAQPLTLRRLDDVERRVKDVIIKQSALKGSLLEAQAQLKAMLATFVDRLAGFSQSTSGYHDTIERCAQRISAATDIAELSQVLAEVMRETRSIQLDAQRSHDDFAGMRERVAAAEREVERLQSELAHASDLVRTDALTGALNRKGMDEAIEREAARARRTGGPLCFALLDIDNFKKLNDGLGHDAGDAALVHLSKVVKETIRPQDTLARYGGEEFVVLLPHTALDDAVSTMVRVQRELTKRFFLHNNEKVLITFSCGVSEWADEASPTETLKRADSGMYLAKRSGKNRVVAN